MNKDIKEILDSLKNKDCYINDEITLTLNEAKELLDYITNLQEEKTGLETKLRWLKNKSEKLQEENNFLKLNNPEMNIEHFRIVKENKRKIDNLRKENKELKQENQKLVKVIDELEKWLKDNIFYGDDDYYDMKAMGVESALNKLTELKGGSDDVEN